MDLELLAKFQQIYKDLDLFPLVEAEDIEKFRVDYGLEVKVRLRREIEASEKNGKFIFAGHRGCGKSTLLKRLANEMSDRHYVVFFSIANLIEMTAVTHTNILYAIALLMTSHAQNLGIDVAGDIRQTVLGWNTTTRKQMQGEETTRELGFEVEFLDVFTAKLQREHSFRDELEKTFEKKISDLVGKIDRLAAAIQIKTKKPVIVIIDDLDKLDLPLVEAIYRNNIKALFSPQIRIVFTISISAIQEPQVMGALNLERVIRPHLFPVTKFFPKDDRHNPEVEPIAKNLNIFLKVLEKRIPEGLIEPQTAHAMVLKSGGVMRELLRIARECCTECMVQIEIEPDREDIIINEEILNIALQNLRHDFARQIGSGLYDLLIEVYETAEAVNDTNFIRMLQTLMILEYENASLWYDLHPIVADLLKQKKLINSKISRPSFNFNISHDSHRRKEALLERINKELAKLEE
ncbi:MAG: ATP-binding protein [Pseudanabaena sp. M135S2SP2A07QC]|nr:ATP-binding protein [Pseudanabaena sp. M090S1SP2A07QC]MCA6524134.1 ATP-binding protein [Pseudanabaena sp. M051S1SP2A07QC]MCA6526869.1 ATP-binding protein [Pseudanabaena sp. M179S2SP2A07QC]MCA6531834.1 ATP-binding protein [Pseudanabaena sp. M125S2SP2A07QC]MCA6535537.1 ATP-binding protein [Pseudanabaena sp. M176S2SP2A07QC]MCA6540735.1 ATP-binding protein [Pseudanabaena sp. M037S2SP2A07QC]MCA6544888.1 ATP-binding protein [Pseudanabaena sp. M074S1SP2A07QC]MCA6546497.1 ATP-binding protein [Pse